MLYKRLFEYTQIQLQSLYSLKLVVSALAGWSGKKTHCSKFLILLVSIFSFFRRKET